MSIDIKSVLEDQPMATPIERHQRLHRSILDAEHREGWPRLSDAEAMAAHERISPAKAQRQEAEADLIEVFERIMSR